MPTEPRNPHRRWAIEHVNRTGSTNADLAQRARAGAPEGAVLVADHQDSGRGRLGREWHTPAGLALTVSFLLRPVTVPPERWSWLPLLAGVAVVDAVSDISNASAVLKWPNDVLIADAGAERKLAGILVERVDTTDTSADPGTLARGLSAAVLGIGVNVLQGSDDLPATATSLRLAGASATRSDMLDALCQRLAESYEMWTTAHGDPQAGLAAAYLKRCGTVGRQVTAVLPGDKRLDGTAVDVDGFGRLVVAAADGSGRRAVGAGDVVHVRTQ